jgi:hypothetical protein
MAKRSRKRHADDTSQEEALRIARGTQRPGQTKEQTKLIAKGVQKGIEQYKKQQSAKARELDRKLKKAGQSPAVPAADEPQMQHKIVYRQHWLPWLLLVLSWLVVAAWAFLA